MESSETSHHNLEETPDISVLKKAIPKHCFEPDVGTSISYVIRDVALVVLLASLALQIPTFESFALRCALWTLYGLVQGFMFTGLWIVAHECGHGALFRQKSANDIVGFVLHSFLLVPYFSWQHTHSRHHRYTNHMEKDTAFVPPRKGAFQMQAFLKRALDISEDAPFLSLMVLIGHQLVGWPIYLLFNTTAGPGSLPVADSDQPMRKSHFDPGADIFADHERLSVAATDIGLLTTVFGLRYLSQQVGFWTMALLYLIPYLWVNNWIVAITYLHHTHPEAAHYEAETWTFKDGALATVDRDFGFVGRHLFHGIIEFHVIHHLFPRIPFYYAEEATDSVRKLLGDRYIREESSFLADLWKTFTTLSYVESEPGNHGVLRWAVPLKHATN